MKIHLSTAEICKKVGSFGFTLVELVVSVAVGVVAVGVIVALTIVTAWHYLATYNYVKMDDMSRNAIDVLSREIRNSTALMSFSTNDPQFLQLTNANDGGDAAKITYDSTARTLSLNKPSQSARTLLTECDSFSFELFNRYPLINSTVMSFYSSTNTTNGALDPKSTKVINMNWKCSRSILGSKLNTEIVQTAQVVVRNKVQ